MGKARAQRGGTKQRKKIGIAVDRKNTCCEEEKRLIETYSGKAVRAFEPKCRGKRGGTQFP